MRGCDRRMWAIKASYANKAWKKRQDKKEERAKQIMNEREENYKKIKGKDYKPREENFYERVLFEEYPGIEKFVEEEDRIKTALDFDNLT